MKIDWRNDVFPVAKDVISDFRRRGIRPTVRAVFYALVSRETIPNTRSAYQRLSRLLVKARLEGSISWYSISDETRSIRGGDYDYYRPRRWVESHVDYILDAYRHYRLPVWLGKEYYVEIWLEKFALADVFRRWVGSLNVVLCPSRGYSSWTFLHDAAIRIDRETRNGRDAVILYFGDFDPSGVDIRRFLGEALDELGIQVDIEHVAVTREQIEEFRLPHRPEDASEVEKLRRDPRFKNWIYGFYRVELDALLALAPDDFMDIVVSSVREYFDEDQYKRVLAAERAIRKYIKEKMIEELKRRLENEV